MSDMMAWAYLKAVLDGPSQHLQQLLRAGHSAKEIAAGVKNREGWIGPLYDETAARASANPHQMLEDADRYGFELIHPGDPRWPATEFSTAFNAAAEGSAVNQKTSIGELTAPHGLWVRGDTDLSRLAARSVAIVGTRTATTYGTDVTRAVATHMVANQYTIISGGALGVDTVAHETALELGGRTMVVMASGPGWWYPQSNIPMFERVVEAGGTLVAEYYPGSHAQRYRFLERNRLVAAMAQGTLVTQAGFRSGALNTLTRAGTFGRLSMVVPGPINDANSMGCNARLRDPGVTAIADIREVHAHLSKVGEVDVDQQMEFEFAPTPIQQLSRNELRVFDAMPKPGEQRHTAEEIAAVANLPIGLTVHLLVDLAKRGVVVREGNAWARV